MILQNKVWTKLVGTDHEARAPRIAGKWLCFGPTQEMHLFRDLLHKLVEDGTLLAAKIARKDPETDPFPHKDCVICVYTTAERDEIERASRKLKEIGLNPSAWKSEADTKADWTSQGKLKLRRTSSRRSVPWPRLPQHRSKRLANPTRYLSAIPRRTVRLWNARSSSFSKVTASTPGIRKTTFKRRPTGSETSSRP